MHEAVIARVDSQPDSLPAPLAVTRLRLSDFRSYHKAAYDGDTRPVVLTGPNGAGKTNMLEAVSFLAPGRGLRQAQLNEIDRRSGDPAGWAVAGTICGASGPVDIGTGREPDRPRRMVRVNGAPVSGQGALGEYVSIVWLTPQMDRLFLDGASARRRFLDRLVFGFDTAHAGRVGGYEHAMRERLRLLKAGRMDDAWLSALEESMAERGVAIAAARREMATRLARACAEGTGPFPRAGIAATGEVESLLDDGPALAAEDCLRERLARTRRLDADSGRTSAGPHRSDFTVRHLEKEMPADQCSTGEQKALLIAVVLADARLQAAERGAAPLLLLDEVAAHLDAEKRQALFAEILALGAQAWLTGTDRTTFAELESRAQFFRVANATLERTS
ncbi:MAG: DNA replication/repair protein RecF [Proteobacteria bacterium]|nr:DNA replication/repair protein RecF [Pseudomonadota bacterium]